MKQVNLFDAFYFSNDVGKVGESTVGNPYNFLKFFKNLQKIVKLP